MSKLLTLQQKISIVKLYYKNNENILMVGAQFGDAFNLFPITTVFHQVLRAFESTGSVVEDMIYAIKEEPAPELEIEEAPSIVIPDDEAEHANGTKGTVAAKKSPIIKRLHVPVRKKTQASPGNTRCRDDGGVIGARNYRPKYIECEECGKQILFCKRKVRIYSSLR